jgi:hypothetical protein
MFQVCIDEIWRMEHPQRKYCRQQYLEVDIEKYLG